MEFADEALPIGELVDERRHLLDVAFWMLGSGVEAEGVVDEAYRRWYALTEAEREVIEEPRAWLSREVGGICLERLARPGRRRRGGPALDPGDVAGEQRRLLEREVSAVLLGALDALSPAERAAFVLSDVFGMAPGTVADIVGRSEPECSELAERARQSLRARRGRPTTPEQQAAVVDEVRAACAAQDAERLVGLLAQDVTAFFDGGGKVRAQVRPVHGREQVARSLLTLLAPRARTTVDPHSVNGRTGLVVRYDRRVAAVISLDLAGPRIVQVWVVVNPDKLRPWNQTAPSCR
ncbi:RNA polymerase subunit sigma [Streptomyces brasiliensis]|uniref:RNA polymerase sigma factor n=1 Tax=Streptomyces brasiliensis TaxID=1954 RepID=A0A917UIY8_9ACTN|nr:RNA polymerase subunit sigma [Streptomyces brasiliensis]GGJ61403.1 RNA polymerase sigma factor [Streptomyces brasiliensis]